MGDSGEDSGVEMKGKGGIDTGLRTMHKPDLYMAGEKNVTTRVDNTRMRRCTELTTCDMDRN